jgi:hypothetical protein
MTIEVESRAEKTYGGVLGGLGVAALEGHAVTLVLETLGSNQALDARSLGVGLGTLLLGLDLTADDELADLFHNTVSIQVQLRLGSKDGESLNRRRWKGGTHIIILAETEEAADLGGTLGAETLGVDNVGKAGDVVLTLLDNSEGKDGQVHGNDAAADRLALALTGTAGAVARVALSEKQTDTSGVHDTLLHGETLLVVATGDLEDVTLPLITDRVTGDLLAHTAVHEDAETALILDLDELLGAVGGVRNVKLHGGSASLVSMAGLG